MAQTIWDLQINAKINPARALAQEDGAQTKPKDIPSYLAKYQHVFEKQASERFPESRPYDHAIDLKPDFLPKDCRDTSSVPLPSQLGSNGIDVPEDDDLQWWLYSVLSRLPLA